MVQPTHVGWDTPWANLPQVAGPLANLHIDNDDDLDLEHAQRQPQTDPSLKPSQAQDFCTFCTSLNIRKIVGANSNRLGFTLKKSCGEVQRDAANCRLCHLLFNSLQDANPSLELPGSHRLHMKPHGRNRKHKHDELYALSVHLVPSGARQTQKDAKLDPEINAGMLSMYVEEDSPASNTAPTPGPIAGREVREAMDLTNIRSWLQQCMNRHSSRCSTNSVFHKKSLIFLDDDHEKRLLPTRTIFVGSNADDDTVYLQEHRDGKRADYVALSYCWGKDSEMVKTTADTFSAHKTGIKVSELPKTFRDAIQITRGIGVQHLWIDALCILQDSKEDWDQEAASMGATYAGAHLTIAALSASSAGGGLFFDRQISAEVVTRPLGVDLESAVPIYLRKSSLSSGLPLMLEEEAHSKRAWTLQERYLSPRVLYCAERQYYWECRSTKHVEDGGVFPEGVMQIREQRPQSLIGSLAHARPQQAFDLWTEVVQTYSWRSLTYAKDKLAALDGLVQTFRPYTKSEYVAGIWMNDLAGALAWRRSRRCTKLTRPDRTRAPSWSWASTDGGLNHLNQRMYFNAPLPAWRGLLQRAITGELAVLSPDHAGSEGLHVGADKTICLQVCGPVVTKSTSKVIELLQTKAIIYMDAEADDDPEVSSSTGVLACLVLAEVRSDNRRAHGLILREVVAGLYERVGLVDIREYQGLSERLVKQTIRII